MRRAVLTLLVAALVVLAGCGGADTTGDGTDEGETPERTQTDRGTATSGGATGTSSVGAGTTSAAPATTTTAPPPADDELPVDDLAWVNESGLRPDELLRAHAVTVNNESSYTTHRTRRIAERNADNETRRTAVLRASQAQERAVLTRTRLARAGDRTRNETVERYWAVEDSEQTLYERVAVDGQVSYRTQEPYRDFETFYDQSTVFEETLGFAVFDFEFVETVRRDGRTLYRFTADSFDERWTDENATNPSATILVSNRGVIRSLEYSYDTVSTGAQVSTGTPVTVAATYEATDLGETTVTAPDWLDEARDNASQGVEVGPTDRDGASSDRTTADESTVRGRTSVRAPCRVDDAARSTVEGDLRRGAAVV